MGDAAASAGAAATARVDTASTDAVMSDRRRTKALQEGESARHRTRDSRSLLTVFISFDELLQGVAAEPVPDPLVAGDGADRLVELDRRLVPVEHGPLEALVP